MPYIFIIMLTSLSLSACNSDSSSAMLNEYQQRMSNVLETDIPRSQAPSTFVQLPEKRARTISTTELRQGLWEVLDFRQCDMLSIISERNSSLGKVMLPSQKMRYEIRFIHALNLCKATLDAIPEPDETQQAFIQRLDEIYKLKATNLPAEIWNGIYASDEIVKHLKPSAEPLPLTTEKTNYSNIQTSLKKLNHLTTLPYNENFELPVWLDNIEAEYAAFHHSDFGSRLLTTLPLLTSTLDNVAEAIETRLARKAFCFKGHQPQRATVLNNVFRKFYVAQVQPYMALLEQQGKPWFETHDAVMTRLPAPAKMQTYHQQTLSMTSQDSLWNQWIVARNRHTKAWQTILGQCNMMPSVQPLRSNQIDSKIEEES